MLMRKSISVLATLLCIGILSGCGNMAGNTAPAADASASQSPDIAVAQSRAVSTASNYVDAYNTLIAYKTDHYASQSITDFNTTLAGDGDDLAELFAFYSSVLEELPADDTNTDFFHITLKCSLNELYCEQLDETVAYNAMVRYLSDPIEPLNEEEQAIMEGSDPAYEFLFMAAYNLYYNIPDQSAVTIGERDAVVLQFQTDLQAFIDSLGKAGLSAGEIRATLTQEAEKIAKSLSNEKISLAVQISNIERHDSGEDAAV